MKLVSAHQPAFIPWVGLLHKLMICDTFIFMDIAKFRKRAFMHRNYIEINKSKNLLSLNINKNADYQNCNEIKISEFHLDCLENIKKKIINTYKNKEYFCDLDEFLSNCFNKNVIDLNSICLHQLEFLKEKLKINTKIILESNIIENQKLKKSPSERLLAHAKNTNANIYVTGINSIEYLDKEMFDREGIKNYIQRFDYKPFLHYQFAKEPLSIIHQISIMGFKNIIKLLNETQMNKERILNIYD